MTHCKKSSAIFALTTLLISPLTALAESCYSVEGKVKSVNQVVVDGVSIVQTGKIKITLTDSSGYIVLDSKGDLIGNLMPYKTEYGPFTEYGPTSATFYLTHTADLKDGSGFVTMDDTAPIDFIYDVRDVAADGTPCSFYVRESITQVIDGTGFFESVGDVGIVADGYISTCPDENENKFELSGFICLD